MAFYIAQRNRAAGFRFQEAAERAFNLLASMPELGSEWLTSRERHVGIRIWTIRGFKKYVIIYRPIEDGIEVLRVVHGSRDLDQLLSDEP